MPKLITNVDWGSSGLPNGVSIDKSTGKISGTPTEVGTFNVPASVVTNYGSANETLKMIVNPGNPVAPKNIYISVGSSKSTSVVLTGDTIYLPLNLFGIRGIAPFGDAKILSTRFCTNTPTLSTTVIYYDEIENTGQYLSIDKATGNLIWRRKKYSLGGTNSFTYRYISINTDKGYVKGTLSLDNNWFGFYVYTGSSGDLATCGDVNTSSRTVRDKVIVGTLTKSNYRSNVIYG